MPFGIHSSYRYGTCFCIIGIYWRVRSRFTSVNTNPAGLGVYKRIEFTFSPSINFSKTNSVYNGIEAYDFKYSFNIGNLGAVFAIPLNQGKWKYMQLATGFNRLHNYHNNYLIEGPNTGLDGKTTSLADYFNFNMPMAIPNRNYLTINTIITTDWVHGHTRHA